MKVKTCKHILDGQFNHDNVIETIEFNGIVIIRLINSLLMLLLLIRNKRRALKEDGKRAMLLVLPSYYSFIILVITYYAVFAALHIAIKNIGSFIVLLSIDISINHALTEGLAFFLMQHGAGVYAFQRSFAFSAIFGLMAFVTYYVILVEAWNDDDTTLTHKTYFAHAVFSFIVLIFYLIVKLLPSTYLFRRPALDFYSTYLVLENFSFLLASTLVYLDNEAGYCTVLTARVAFMGICHPLNFMYCLAKDSEYWQGFCGLGDHSPVVDAWDLTLASAETMGTVLSDMQRQTRTLPILHFGAIEFPIQSFVSGGLSRVYFGKYKQQDVAIKILFAIDLTPKVVMDFYSEVQVMYQLQHPNIVKCLGISVMPPTICEILEYCPYGSLYDYLYNTDAKMASVGSGRVRSMSSDKSSVENIGVKSKRKLSMELPVRQTFDSIEQSSQRESIANSSFAVMNPINEKHNAPTDCSPTITSSKSKTRRSKLLGTFSDVFSRLRITTTSNRLTLTAPPLSVIEFRRAINNKDIPLPKNLSHADIYRLMLGAARGICFLHQNGYMHCDVKSPNFLISKDFVIKLSDLGEARQIGKEYPNLPFPAYNWAPPELLNPNTSERFYDLSSDIYGLAIVFSEIIIQELPMDIMFSTSEESQLYHYLVTDNRRPHIPEYFPSELRNLVCRAWSTNASSRPLASEIVSVLEEVLDDELSLKSRHSSVV